MDTDAKRVYVGTAEVVLTAMEYAILELLLKNPRQIFSKARLFTAVCGETYISGDNTIHVHMSNIRNIQKKKLHQGETKEHFIYNFFAEFMSKDNMVLEDFERSIMDMEDNILHDKNSNYQNKMMPIRRQLLILRSYYEQLSEMGKAFEENENRFFMKKQLKYFGTLTDRAERLMGRTGQLIDYAKQVTDAYQSQVDAKQNNNMQFLTIISTIFLPLTLITSWYGMNFKNMPELDNGYPVIIGVCLLVIVICIILFKKKSIL